MTMVSKLSMGAHFGFGHIGQPVRIAYGLYLNHGDIPHGFAPGVREKTLMLGSEGIRIRKAPDYSNT